MHAAFALLLIVRLYDTASVPARDLRAASTIAADAIRTAKIDVDWVICPSPAIDAVNHWPGCHDEPGGGELFVRISRSTGMAADAGTLGYAFVDRSRSEGALATVFVDRVDTLARRAAIDRSALLGRAIAHEIGHLLLGNTSHSQTGLMRARWSERELRLGFPRDWTFSRDEAIRMRDRLSERMRIAADRR